MSEIQLNEEVTPEGSINEEGAESPMITPAIPGEPDFMYPKDFNVEVPVEDLSDEALANYHDNAHILWNKYERGMPLDFGFNMLILTHYRIVKELERRGFTHFEPINALDVIRVTPKELIHHSEEMSKKKVENEGKDSSNLSLEPPIILKEKEI